MCCLVATATARPGIQAMLRQKELSAP